MSQLLIVLSLGQHGNAWAVLPMHHMTCWQVQPSSSSPWTYWLAGTVGVVTVRVVAWEHLQCRQGLQMAPGHLATVLAVQTCWRFSEGPLARLLCRTPVSCCPYVMWEPSRAQTAAGPRPHGL